MNQKFNIVKKPDKIKKYIQSTIEVIKNLSQDESVLFTFNDYKKAVSKQCYLYKLSKMSKVNISTSIRIDNSKYNLYVFKKY